MLCGVSTTVDDAMTLQDNQLVFKQTACPAWNIRVLYNEQVLLVTKLHGRWRNVFVFGALAA